MANYIPVLVREDRLHEVHKVLSIEPLARAADPTQATDKDQSTESSARDDKRDDKRDDARDDARWDAFWAVPDNVREHLLDRSPLAHAMLRALAELADESRWMNTDDIAAAISESTSRVASAFGPFGRYLLNRDLGWPIRWQFDVDGRVEYQIAPAVAAVILDMLKAETPKVST